MPKRLQRSESRFAGLRSISRCCPSLRTIQELGPEKIGTPGVGVALDSLRFREVRVIRPVANRVVAERQ